MCKGAKYVCQNEKKHQNQQKMFIFTAVSKVVMVIQNLTDSIILNTIQTLGRK